MLWLWIGFLLFVFIMLALDLFVLNREAHEVNVREAITWTGVCIGLALVFNVAVYFIYAHDWLGIASKFVAEHAPDPNLPEGGAAAAASGHTVGLKAAAEFFTGWLIEYSLSLDNIFVIAVIFTHFAVPLRLQHRVLFWGILGALVSRGVMIFLGAALVQRFDWMMYIFGAFLVFTAVKLIGHDSEPDLEKNRVLRLARKVLPVSSRHHSDRFFCREAGKFVVTPLFLVLLVVETTDVIFAVDSIPAIFGITRDPFLVFTSNVFAILGLRSLYFALAAMIRQFKYLNYSLAFILAFVGVKMIIETLTTHVPSINIHISTRLSLGVIVLALAAGVAASLRAAKAQPAKNAPDAPAQ